MPPDDDDRLDRRPLGERPGVNQSPLGPTFRDGPRNSPQSTLLRDRGIVAVIPEPRDQRANRKRRGSRGGRPVSYDRDTYKGRNVVERSFASLKQRRGLATRYDKLAIVYRAAAVPAAVITWLRHKGDTP